MKLLIILKENSTDESFIKKYEISEKNFINIEINLNEFLKTVENIRNFIKVSSPKRLFLIMVVQILVNHYM